MLLLHEDVTRVQGQMNGPLEETFRNCVRKIRPSDYGK